MGKKKRKRRIQPHSRTRRKTIDTWRKNTPVLLAIILLCGGVIILYSLSTVDKETKRIGGFSKPHEASFQKEGELVFIDTVRQEILKEIDIEIADTYDEREIGLMFRKSMQEDQGILFIYAKEGLRGMWMKNTYISLDILFINGKHDIITIYKNTLPLSTNHMLSNKDAMYVVEVIAGFCDTYKIKEGDRVRFEYN